MQKTKVEDVNVTGTAPLLSPNDLDEHLPITEEIADHVVRGRAQIEAILNSTDDRLFVIVGPCSIHDEA
ncbi:MAG: 3-deoxy-7-phosphoheptulonate synthase, partial [Chloroflexota bacterium]|nr:3-deoxy-7-phosphoheptulonate synthase [Chloroflexota bacterium]